MHACVSAYAVLCCYELVFSYNCSLFKHFFLYVELVIIVVCLNTFFFTLNYHTFNLNCIPLHATLMVFF